MPIISFSRLGLQPGQDSIAPVYRTSDGRQCSTRPAGSRASAKANYASHNINHD